MSQKQEGPTARVVAESARGWALLEDSEYGRQWREGSNRDATVHPSVNIIYLIRRFVRLKKSCSGSACMSRLGTTQLAACSLLYS